jgi:hypothetical protein
MIPRGRSTLSNPIRAENTLYLGLACYTVIKTRFLFPEFSWARIERSVCGFLGDSLHDTFMEMTQGSKKRRRYCGAGGGGEESRAPAKP